MKRKLSRLSERQIKIQEDIESFKSPTLNQSVIGKYQSQIYEPAIVPEIINVLLSHPNEVIRLSAVSTLSSYIEEAEIIVPALIKSALEDSSTQVQQRAIESLVNFGDKAANAIPKLEEIRDKSNDINIRRTAANTIESLNNTILYPFCPKCGKGSFAYHPIPSTSQIETAHKYRSHIVQSGGGPENTRPVSIYSHSMKTFAAIVYCLNCGYIISAVGGFRT